MTQDEAIKQEVEMALLNIAGHEAQLKAWAKYILELYEKPFEKIDKDLVKLLKEKARSRHGEFLNKYIVQDHQLIDLFSTHLGNFFDALQRATPQERLELFEKQDKLTQEFEQSVQERITKQAA